MRGGWVLYSGVSGSPAGPSIHVSAPDPLNQADASPQTPELADLTRMGRRLVRRFVTTARADEKPTLQSVLAAHFGPAVGSLPVVSDSWAPYEHVNVQLGLEGWLADEQLSHSLLGITRFQNNMFTLADLARTEATPFGPGLGSVTMANQPSGPGGQTYPCVQCALYLIDEDNGGPLAVLLRGSDSRGPQQSVSVEVMANDSGLAAAALEKIRVVAADRNVFRGQVLAFTAQMFGPQELTPISFQERPNLDRAALILPDGVLETIERQIVGVAAHRQRLLASRQHLKRGLLLHGAPGRR